MELHIQNIILMNARPLRTCRKKQVKKDFNVLKNYQQLHYDKIPHVQSHPARYLQTNWIGTPTIT